MGRETLSPQISDAAAGLNRYLGLGSATILVIANMIGTGIFTTSGFILSALQNPQAMLLCWFVGGVLAFSGALCYAELGAMFPAAGGEYIFLRESFGRLMAFLSGWISLIVGFSAPIAAAAMAFAPYLFQALPFGTPGWDSLLLLRVGPVTITPRSLAAVAVIGLFSLIHWGGLRFGSRVQNVLTILKIGAVLAFISGGLLLGRGSTSHFVSTASMDLLFSESFATSLIFISFSYSGWNAAAYLGAEIQAPARNIPRALLGGTIFVTLLYLLLNVVFVYALPVEEMRGVLEVGAKSARFLFGSSIGAGFSLAIALCLLSVISAMVLAGPRVYYAMAKDGAFFSRLGKVNGRRTTPGSAIFLQALLAILMVITSAFDKLLLYIGFTLSLFSMLTVLGLVILRYRCPRCSRPYRTFGYPVTPVVFMAGNLWIVLFSLRGNPLVSIYGGATILAGVLLFFYFAGVNRAFARPQGSTGVREKG